MTNCPCCAEPWVLGEESAEGDTPWNAASKFYLYVGTVTTTIATSQAFTQSGTTEGQSWDGTDTYITDRIASSTTQWLRRYSGQFSSTLKDSVNTASISGTNICTGESWTGASVYFIDLNTTNRFLEVSGNFTSTIKQSVAIDNRAHEGISHDETDTYSQEQPFGSSNGKLLKYSGQFTSTLKTSASLTSQIIDSDLTWDGSKILNAVEDVGGGNGRIQVYAGFSSTITDSAAFAGVAALKGLNSNNSTVG